MKPRQHWTNCLKLTILLISSLTLLTGCKKDKKALQNTPPSATSVTVVLGSGQATGHYTYTDNEGDEEDNSLFQWYKADDDTGTNEIKIANATAKTYMYQPDDQGAFLAFEVTPVQKDGQTGNPVKSPFAGSVVYDNDNMPDIELKFLDEFVYPAGQMFQGTTIGGLSGIHYENGVYYILLTRNKPSMPHIFLIWKALFCTMELLSSHLKAVSTVTKNRVFLLQIHKVIFYRNTIFRIIF